MQKKTQLEKPGPRARGQAHVMNTKYATEMRSAQTLLEDRRLTYEIRTMKRPSLTLVGRVKEYKYILL